MKKISQCPVEFTNHDLEIVQKSLEIYPGDFPGLLEGMEVEKEHADFTECNPILTARIALAHLRETPDYYKKLKEAGL